MDSKANTLLEALIFGDSQAVSYRQLSRALTVHVNEAKQLLYTFYTDVVPRVRATYMVGGRLVNGNTQFVLVSENRLEAVKASFDQLLTIHIYSLEPSKDAKNDLTLISNSTAAVRKLDSTKSSLELHQNYGVICYSPLVNNSTGVLDQQKPITSATPANTDIKELPKSVNSMFSSTSSSSAHSPKSVSPIMAPKGAPLTCKPKKMSLAATFAAARNRSKPEPREQVVIAHNNDHNEGDYNLEEDKPTSGKSIVSMQARKQQEEDLKKVLFDEDAEEEFYQTRAKPVEPIKEDDTMDVDVILPAGSINNKTVAPFSDNEENEDDNEAESDVMSNGLFVNADPLLFPEEEQADHENNGHDQPMKKVTKRVTQTDADGYLITKTVDEWVPCTPEEADESHGSVLSKTKSMPSSKSTMKFLKSQSIKPLSKPTASKSKKSTGKAKQTSLTAFFK